MAETLDDGEFWLPSQFLNDEEVFMDKAFGKREKGSFPSEFPSGFGLDLSSPIESVVGSTETESDEEDYLAGLTRRLAHTTFEDEALFGYDCTKPRVLSGSPQSTLCPLGSGWGPTRPSPNTQARVAPPAAPWDLLYAAAGEVAKMRMKSQEEGYGSFNQSNPVGILAPPRKPSPISVPVKPDVGFYHNESLSHLQLQTKEFERLRQQQIMKRQGSGVWNTQLHQHNHEMVQNGGRNSGDFVGPNRNVRCAMGLSPSAWPSVQQAQQQQQKQNGSGMRAVFLGNHGGKRECAGTGVFLPRRTGTQTESRRKPACSTVLLPAKVVQALNLNLDEMGAQPHIQPRYDGASIANDYCVNLRVRGNPVHGYQKRLQHEIRLPQEWTY